MSASTKEEAENYINERMAEATEQLDDASILFTDFMNSLQQNTTALADIPFVENGLLDIDEYTPEDFKKSTPRFSGRTIAGATEATLLPFVPISPFGDITIPDAPDDIDSPSGEITFVEENYLSNLLDSLKADLGANLDGGSGLSAEVEQAIYNRALSRETEMTEARAVEVGNNFVDSGFDLPNGIYASRMAGVALESQRAMTNINNDILVQAATLEQSNRAKVLDVITQVESVLIGYHSSKQQRVLDAEVSQIGNTIEVWKTTWLRYTNLMEAAKLEAEVSRSKIEAEALTNRAIGDQNTAELGRAKSELDRYIAEIDAEVRVFEANVAEFNAEITRYNTVESAKAKANETNVLALSKQAEMAIKAADINIQAVIAVRSVLLEAAKSGASVSAQVLASALNSVNAGVSYGFSGSIGDSTSYGHDMTKGQATGATTQNIHNWDETGAQ